MAITKRSLVLTFGTPIKTDLTITVASPNAALEGTDIKRSMDSILASNALGEVAVADSIMGAKYVIQQVDEVDFEA